MADFSKNAEIISRCLGYRVNKFIKAFDKNVKLQATEAIEANPVGNVAIKFIECQQNSQWEGTATELLAAFLELAAELKININQKSWLKAPNALSKKLNEIRTRGKLESW